MNKGIKRQELLWVGILYVIFAFGYHLAIKFNQYGGEPNLLGKLFNPYSFWRTSGLHYTLFFFASLPIWWLIFRKLKTYAFRYKLLAHLLCLPLFTLGTQQLYYAITEAWNWPHLQGSGQVWDIYIPGLFYLIQFGILHGYEYYRENQKKIRLEGELRQAALKSELAALKAQLNPHFLYNVFNTINAAVPEENEKARNMIAQLSDLFRYQLQASRVELVSLQEELNFVRKYLDLEKARFEERLSIHIEVPEELMQEKIPPMLLQPLVENSVKHGLSSLIEGGSITIKIFRQDDKLKFEVSDTGIGIRDKESVFDQGLGLTNTRVRLQKRYQSELQLLDNQPRGLKICFSL